MSVPEFIKLLTGSVGLSPSEALGCTSALIKSGYNKASPSSSSSSPLSPASAINPFTGVSEVSLVAAGVTDPDVRKVIVAYGRSGKGKTSIARAGGNHRKRKSREHDLDRPLPDKPHERKAMSLEFDEELEDYLLQDRSLVINRAPVMTAWATVVAERLGFTRQEALSIAHTYTNANATSKGVSLGIYSPEEGKQKTTVGPSQPYVDLMGRKIPMLSLQTGEWRGIANGAIAEPEQAFGYIQRSFRQHMPAAMGAFRLLADSFEPEDLNKAGYQLYAEFRPEVVNWGQKGHLQLRAVLDLRRDIAKTVNSDTAVLADVKVEEEQGVKDEEPELMFAREVHPGATQKQTVTAKQEGDADDLLQTEESAKKKTKHSGQSSPPAAGDDLVDPPGDALDDGGISDSDLLAL